MLKEYLIHRDDMQAVNDCLTESFVIDGHVRGLQGVAFSEAGDSQYRVSFVFSGPALSDIGYCWGDLPFIEFAAPARMAVADTFPPAKLKEAILRAAQLPVPAPKNYPGDVPSPAAPPAPRGGTR